MSTLNHLFDLPEQICYVQCGFCTTILLVSVPCSSLSMVVTVRCGHCSSLLSVNMMKASFVPLQLLASLGHDHDDEPKEGAVCEEVAAPRKTAAHRRSPSLMTSSDNEEEDIVRVNPTVNKPPEKRQRAPSAYNRFIKLIPGGREEIRRLKAQNPNIPHKEAFSTAAKNWAHFPPMDTKGDGESCGLDEGQALWNSDATQVLHVSRFDGKNKFTYKAMLSVKEKPQGVPYGPRHRLREDALDIDFY
ncbi:Plant-specific transcription factor YABBY family protein [Theobroma cacao]|uniref:Plant-specific transcription factor YABBY family protein n=1 Tax=Theobroma cacao TaxID=3641 RepID=A0A061E686_THECC|nr:Plant-specific transcription factor YABBY family protein [Theobroma cacao]